MPVEVSSSPDSDNDPLLDPLEGCLNDVGILIVDDQSDHLELMQELLENAGHKNLYLAHSGKEALSLLKKEPGIGLVLLDLVMPGIDGYEVCRTIKSSDVFSDLFVIVVTGGSFDIEATVQKSFKLGAMDFLSKPFNRVELISRVRSALSLFYEKESNKKQKEKLAKSEERLALAVMDKTNGIWDWNVSSGEIYFSENWVELLSLDSSELSDGLGIWKSRIHPEESDIVISRMKDLWERKRDHFFEEHRLRCQNGEYRWVISRGKAVWNESGNVVRMAGSLTDVTEKKLLEKQVTYMQKMEGIDRFAGGVAHDLNNMVMVVNSYSRFIQDAVPENQEIADYIQEIRNATAYSSSLVKQLMAFSRKSQIQLEYVFISAEIEDLSRMVSTVLGEERCLVTRLEKNMPPVLADHSMISQVVLNLVINSKDAMPNEGTLTIETRLMTLEKQKLLTNRVIEPGRFVCLSVSDTGTGMDSKTIENIFEPFFTTKKDFAGHSGAGLGLSTVFAIMKEHKGWIDVRSDIGKGSMFELYFPLFVEGIED